MTRSRRSAAKAGEAKIWADDGAGLLPSAVGVMVFLVLLLFSVQICFALYANSTMTAAAWDAARIASGEDASADRASAEIAGDVHLRRVLGEFGDRVTTTWSWQDDRVSLTVRADQPGFLPSVLRRPLRIDHFERTVLVRLERSR
ncbi:MAG: TadE/TadG family type IV pilus assembly protein [Acidimicrobiales bacterium]